MSGVIIALASTQIANRLLAELEQRRIGKLDADGVRAAVAGYCCTRVLTVGDTNQLFDVTLRKVVEGAAK